MSRKKFINRSESDELIEDLTLNPYEVNESFRRGIQNEGDEYLEKIEKMVMAEKDINKNNRNFIKFFDNLNRKVHKNDSPIEILTECEKFGFDTETLLRLGTIVIESSPKLPEIQISRGISDKSDERYADDDFEEYTGDDVTEDVELPRAKTAQSIVPPPEVKPKGPRIHSAPVALVTPLNINHFPTESNSSSQVKVNHKQAGWIKRGEWRIGTRIGSGSFGEVFQGMSDDGLLFAVKKLSLVPNKEIANLASEIELMRVLDHPNIVKYLGVKVDEVAGVIYIFQEWVPGGSVEKLLQNYGVFSIGVIRNYTRQILTGLEYLHANGIVHRDIKGGNILVDESTVKLADFGASTTMPLGETEEFSTIAGTPYFMAPEVFVSKYGRRGDIWAVGCTIIQMLTGDPPWKDRKLHSIVQLHVLLSSWVGIPPINREIPDDLRNLLELCFEKDPKNRPMAEELLKHPFLNDLYEERIDSLGSTSGIDIREQLERAAARAHFRPDEDSEFIHTSSRRPHHVVESPRIPESNGNIPATPYLQPFQSDFPSPIPRHRHSSHESNSSNGSDPSPQNPFSKKSTPSPSPNNPFGRNHRASTNSISPQQTKTPGMMPSASENSFLKSPGISALPNSKQKIRHEPPPITKLKAWSPSDLSEHEDSQQHNTEGDDSLQYSDHSKAKNSVAEGQNIEDDNYSFDHYSDEDEYTSGTPVQRQENKVQPANGQSNRTSATPIYPEISSAKVKDPPRKSSKENIELPSQVSNPSETPSKQVTKGQAYGTRIPPLVPHPSQSDPSSQSNDNAGRKNLSKMHSAQSSASEHGDHGSNSKGIKIMKRQKIPSDIPPLTQGREAVLNPSLSKSSLHPREEKRSDQARASSASLAVGKKKWRCTNKNCVHINYEEDNYCSNCGSIRRSNPSMISATRKS